MAEILLLIGIGVLSCCLILTLIALCLLSGLFESIDISTGKPPIGKAVIAYKFATGPYKECGSLFTEVAKLTPGTYRSIGIYYDDPKVVEPQDLRYAVGAILSENDSTVDDQVKNGLLQEGFKIFHLPEVSYAVKTKFPYKTSLSILIAVARVYPRLESYVKEHKLCAHPYLEIYDGSMIQFMGPLAKQNEFYVDEASANRRHAEDDADEDEDEGSLLSHTSRETSYTVNGDDSESEDDAEDSNNELSAVEESPKREITPVKEQEVKSVEGDQSTQEVLSSVSGTNFQDSGFSSEQVNTPEVSPVKIEEENLNVSDGNESASSSFEEISVEDENIPTQ